MTQTKVVYLDRDGTINLDRHYLSAPEEFEFCSGAIDGMRTLAEHGMDLVVVTNQSGIGRGYFTRGDLEVLHAHMCRRLAEHGLSLAGIYVCPHAPGECCDCRKPKPGLIHKAEAVFGRRPGVMIGDSIRDVVAGQAAGLQTIALFDVEVARSSEVLPDFFAKDLREAAAWVIDKMKL